MTALTKMRNSGFESIRSGRLAASGSRKALITREEQAKQELLEESLSSLNKVRFASVSLHGREKQLAALTECFRKYSQRSEGMELADIEGLSGMGKTRLAESLKNEKGFRSSKGHLVIGKHELQSSEEPFAGISQCCQSICRSLLQMEEAVLIAFRGRLREALDPRDIAYLAKIMPLIRELVDISGMDDSAGREFQTGAHR